MFLFYLNFFSESERSIIEDYKPLNGDKTPEPDVEINATLDSGKKSTLVKGSESVGSTEPEFSEKVFEGSIIQGVLPDVERKQLKKGKSILVKNRLAPNLEPSFFTPFWHYDQVVSVSIERRYTVGGELELAQVIPINDVNWSRYPPVSQADAESRLLEYVDASYTYDGLVYDVPHIPEYLFKVSGLDEVFLVDAYSGAVRTVSKDIKSHHDKPILKMNMDGLVELITENVKDLSDDEMRVLREELEEENKAIKNGLLKLDEEFNVIFDKRELN